MLHSISKRKKGKKGLAAIKHDMSKAYSRVEWSFLGCVMEKLGFPHKWTSVVMDEEERILLDYSGDRMIVDKAFQISLLSRIAEAGKIIESLYGSPQDIEVVKDGVIYVVQARPQI